MSEEELIRIVKKSKEPVRSMQELSKKLIGTRTGMFFYTENFRLDFDTFCGKLDYYEKEIERLKEEIEEYQKALDETTSEKIELANIIKEVRENIDKKLNVFSDYVDYDFGTELLRQELFEILDKENEK